jgi:hypothetical protein
MPRTAKSESTYETARFRAKRRVRQAKRAKRRARYVQPTAISYGVRPLSKFHPSHPVWLYEPGDPRRDNYDRARFV